VYPSSWISFRSLGLCCQPSAQRFAKCSSKKAGARGVGSIWLRSGNSTRPTQVVRRFRLIPVPRTMCN
jgi:hypothetical protein